MRLLLWNPLVLLVVAAIAVTGCTRGSKDENTSISFMLPERANKVASANSKLVPFQSVTSMTGTTDVPVLSHVIINVSGGGISPSILKTWDKHSSSTALGSTFTLESVPRGDNRLFQLLAVYENPSTKSMTIFYGDATKSLSAAEETVDITLSSISGTQQAVDGHISGRYFNSASGGPSADLAIKYTPAGRPAMTIERTVMYNGWFSVFSLSNVTFSYELQTGPLQTTPEVLFGGPVSLHSAIFNPNESSPEWYRRSAAYIPFHTRQEYGSNNTVTWKSEGASIYVWGFWGNAAAKADASWNQRRICRDSLTGSLTRMKKFTPVVAEQSSQPGLIVSNLINFGLTPPADAILLDQTGTEPGTGYITFLGGDTVCPPAGQSAGTEWTNWFRVTKKQVDGNGSDSAAGFRGPFKVDSNLNPVTVTQADPRVIIAKVLPGVATAVDEFRVYKKTGVNNDYRVDSPKCASIAAGAVGFSPAGSAGIDAQGTVTLNTSITAADVTAGVAAIICPYKTGIPYAEGLFVSGWNFSQSGGGGGGSTPIATKLAAYFLHDPANVTNPQVYNWSCVPLVIQAQDAAGNPAMLPSGASIGATGTAADKFSTTNDCNNALGGGNWNPQWIGAGQMLVYYRSERTGGNPGLSFSITSTGGSTAVTAANVTFSSSDSGGAATHLRVTGASANITAFGCYPVQFFTVQNSGSTIPAVLGAASTAWPAVTGSTGDVQFFDDPGCTQYASGMTFGDFSASQISHSAKYFSYRSMTSAPFSISATNLGVIATTDTLNIGSVTTPDEAFRINVMTAQQWMGGQCQPVTFQMVDSFGRPTPLPANYGGDGTVQISVTGTTGQFYHSAGCISSTATTAYISPNGSTTQTTLYFMPSGSGSGEIHADIVGSSAQYSGMAPISVMPETASQFVYVFPGQIWNPGDSYISGTAYPIIMGAPVAVKVYAIKSSNRMVDPNYVSGLGMILNGGAPFTVANAGPFTAGDAGVKTIMVTFAGPGNADFGNISYFSNTFGLNLRPGFSSYYNMNVLTNLPQVVTAYMAGGYQPTLDQTVCQPVVLQPNLNFYAGVNYAPAMPGGNAFVILSPLGSAAMYSNDYCTTPITSGTVIAAGVRQVIAYTKFTNLGYNSAGWNSQNPPYPGIVLDGYGTATPATGLARFNILGPSGIVTGVCQPFAVTGTDGNYNSVLATTVVNLSIPFTDAVGQFYSDSSCTSTTTTVTLSNERAKTFYYKATSVPANGHGNVQINANDGTFAGSTYLDILRYQ